MGLFKADLFRSFVVGFALGAIGLAVTLDNGSGDGAASMVSPAVAAPVQASGTGSGMNAQ